MKKNIFILSIGNIIIGIHSEIALELSFENQIFLTDTMTEDISIHVIFSDGLPGLNGTYCGSDMMFQYYRDEYYHYMLARKGVDGSVSLAKYTPDFKEFNLYINETAFPNTVRTMDKVLQLLPMKQILTYHNILMLHSSRIMINHKAILFTAPSQTGKTTQAHLWSKYENAQIVSNDRSLLAKINNHYDTYGYPVDGSSPVYNNEKILLGAIIVLRQSNTNEISRLSVHDSFKYLMSQTVTEHWDNEQRTYAMQLLLNLLNDSPVYLLKCRPDQASVFCLKRQLIKDKVIEIGFDT